MSPIDCEFISYGGRAWPKPTFPWHWGRGSGQSTYAQPLA